MKDSLLWAGYAFRNVHPVLSTLRDDTPHPSTITEFICGGNRRVTRAPPFDEFALGLGDGNRQRIAPHPARPLDGADRDRRPPRIDRPGAAIYGLGASQVRTPAHGPFPGLDAVSWPRTQNQIKLKSNSILDPSEVEMSHASMLKARRQHQKTKKLLDVAAKQAKRLAKQALAGPAVKKKKVKKEKVKKEKVATEKIETEKVKKVKPTKEELGRQDAKRSSAVAGKKGAS
jgi:hypothetical protein